MTRDLINWLNFDLYTSTLKNKNIRLTINCKKGWLSHVIVLASKLKHVINQS